MCEISDILFHVSAAQIAVEITIDLHRCNLMDVLTAADPDWVQLLIKCLLLYHSSIKCDSPLNMFFAMDSGKTLYKPLPTRDLHISLQGLLTLRSHSFASLAYV